MNAECWWVWRCAWLGMVRLMDMVELENRYHDEHRGSGPHETEKKADVAVDTINVPDFYVFSLVLPRSTKLTDFLILSLRFSYTLSCVYIKGHESAILASSLHRPNRHLDFPHEVLSQIADRWLHGPQWRYPPGLLALPSTENDILPNMASPFLLQNIFDTRLKSELESNVFDLDTWRFSAIRSLFIIIAGYFRRLFISFTQVFSRTNKFNLFLRMRWPLSWL